MSRSADMFARANAVTPGGVHSPVRAFRRVGGTPLFIRSAQGSWIEAVGSILFRLLCAIILFFCAFGVLGGLWQRTRPKGEEDRIGWGMMLFALVLGYFAWFGVLG